MDRPALVNALHAASSSQRQQRKMNRHRAIMSLGLAAGLIFCGAIGTRRLLAPAANITPRMVEIAPDATKPPGNVVRERELSGNPLWAIPLASLSATQERPVFSPSRRPPAPAVAAPPPRVEPAMPVARPAEPERPPLALVATVIGDSESMAVFTETTTSNVVRLRTEEDHAGWILRSVKGREAILQKDNETAILALPPPGSVTSGDPGGLLPPLPQRLPTLLPVRVTAGNPPEIPPRVR